MNAKPKFPWIAYLIVLFTILAVALAPVGSVVLCSWIANSHGCKVDEGSVHACVIGGKDYGQLLYTLGVLGWLMLLTVPGGAVAFIICLVVLLVHRSNWRKWLSTQVS
jgi:hypothetical protein